MTDLRISRDQAFMQIAEVWAKRSTCMRRNVGAVVVVDKQIICHGYNGAEAGKPHCTGQDCIPPGEIGCGRAIHAEANAIRYLPRGYENISKIMYTTESPCMACAISIARHNFHAIYYLNEYRVTAGIRYLLNMGTSVYRMTPAGMVIRKKLSGEDLVEEILR